MATQFIDVHEVAKRCGLAVSTVWAWAKEDKLPKPIKLGGRTTRWSSDDIEAWQRACIEKADARS